MKKDVIPSLRDAELICKQEIQSPHSTHQRVKWEATPVAGLSHPGKGAGTGGEPQASHSGKGLSTGEEG